MGACKSSSGLRVPCSRSCTQGRSSIGLLHALMLVPVSPGCHTNVLVLLLARHPPLLGAFHRRKTQLTLVDRVLPLLFQTNQRLPAVPTPLSCSLRPMLRA